MTPKSLEMNPIKKAGKAAIDYGIDFDQLDYALFLMPA